MIQRFIHYLQGLSCPILSPKRKGQTRPSVVVVSHDGNYIGAVGVYPPELRVYDVAELSMKFCRGFTCEIVDFIFLSHDYKKIALLHADRTLELHAQGGVHHTLRIPFIGRRLTYLSYSAELLIVGSSSEILRLDLEGGIFQQPVVTECDSINCCVSSSTLPLVFVGGSPGFIQIFDTRDWTCVKTLPLVDSSQLNSVDVTALSLSAHGLFLAVGTSDGLCRVYDIRHASPLACRDHRNGFPIVSIKFSTRAETFQYHTTCELTLVSADKKGVKVWDIETLNSTGSQRKTRLLASIDARVFSDELKADKEAHSGAINGIELYPNSGLIFVAQDNPRIGVYFISALGLAPRWCSFLDLLTEELEEDTEEYVYEDFQFVTKQVLQQLDADHLIGTPLLRPYMHGFFMDGRLYEKLKAVSQYQQNVELRKKRIEERIARKSTMRLPARRTTRPVNKDLANRLERNATTKGKTAEAAKALLTDERFTQMFTDPNFAVEQITLGET